MLSIRQYEEADYNACRNRLWPQLTERHRDIYNAPGIGGDDPGSDFDDHLRNVGPSRLWVAELDGEVVGLTGLIVGAANEIEPMSEIEPLVVDKAYRGSGVGSAMIDFLKVYVGTNDLPEIVVRPVARNKLMLEFMKKQGFDTLGIVELIMRDESGPSNWAYGAEVSGVSFKV